MSMDRNSDGASSRMNLKTFRTHFAELVDLAEQWQIDWPKLVFIGNRNESAVKNLIECLFGFAIDLKDITNPVEYRFIDDESCGDDQVFCTVGRSSVEIDFPDEYDLLIDRINRYSDWIMPADGYRPIIVEMRGKGLNKMEIVDSPLSCTKGMFDSLARASAKLHPIIAITVGVAESAFVPASFVRVNIEPPPVGSGSMNEFIPQIRSAILTSIANGPYMARTRSQVINQLTELGDPSPTTDLGKLRYLLKSSSDYKSSLEGSLGECLISREFKNQLHRRLRMFCDKETYTLVELFMERLREIFCWLVPRGFSRFPLIKSELSRVSSTLLDTIAQPMLDGTVNFLLQSHFKVIHEFVCPIRGMHAYNCDYLYFAEALFRNVLEEIRVKVCQRLLLDVNLLLPEWTHIMRESKEISATRDKLQKKLKRMHSFYLGHSIDDARSI